MANKEKTEGVLASAGRLNELTKDWFTEDEWLRVEDFGGGVYAWRVSRTCDHLVFCGYDKSQADGRLVEVRKLSDSSCLVLNRWRIGDSEGLPDHISYYIVNLFGNGSVMDKCWGGSELSLAGVGEVLEDLARAVSGVQLTNDV